MFRPIQYITQGFISFFGITAPTPKEQRHAEWFITALLLIIVLGAAAVFAILVLGFGH